MDPPYFTTVISARELRDHQRDPDWVVFDCRFTLANTSLGERLYREAHVPGARYAHLDRDLSGPVLAGCGRHPLPEAGGFARWLGAQGVGPETQVVVYDESRGAIAARLWWMLRWLGHDKVALLDGGLAHWREQGLPLVPELPEPRAREFSGTPERSLWRSSAEVAARVNDAGIVLVDAREPKRFRGAEEPIDRVAGHVPGAVNLPWEGNLDAAGGFLPAAALRARFRAATGGRGAGEVVHMCGSGVTACHNILAMEIAGLGGSLLYPGSWSEWITDPARPIVKSESEVASDK